jgi:hypothetical protein
MKKRLKALELEIALLRKEIELLRQTTPHIQYVPLPMLPQNPYPYSPMTPPYPYYNGPWVTNAGSLTGNSTLAIAHG